MAALDDLIAIYKEAQLALIKIITGNTGAGTKTYYNTILRQLTALLNQLAAQTGRYISTEIPKEYKAALEQTYDYFKRNNLQMNLPEMFAQIHSDAVSELAAEMQHHITEGISSAGRRVMRYADIARDNALRQNGLRASAVKIASAQTVRDMQKDLIRRLSEDGFLTVQYGSGKYAYQVGLDSYAAMVARSTTREAGNLAREKQLLANGYDLVVITEHKPCCELCARVQGRVFSISGKDKRFPPLSAAFTSGYRNVHPNCRCVAVPWIEEMRSPEERQAAIEKGSQPLRDERSDKEKALYTQQQSDRRQMRADLIQYERYKARLGSDAPKSFSAFRRVKNAGGDRWEALQKEYRQRFENVHNSSIDNSGGSGIIKNIELPSETNEVRSMSEETKKQISDAIDQIQSEYDVEIDEFVTEELKEEYKNVPFQFQPAKGRNAELIKRLVINSKYDFMGTQEEFQKRIMRNFNKGTLASNSILGLIAHELAHIMTFQDVYTFSGYLLEQKVVSKRMVYGISIYADVSDDGAECIAEAFAAKMCGLPISREAQELLDEFIEKRRKV